MSRYFKFRIFFASIALMFLLVLPSAVVAGMYATCTDCHTLPVSQARGEMGPHGYGYPPSPEALCSGCHDPAPHGDYASQPYLWQWPLQNGGPQTPSVMTQVCVNAQCHPNFSSIGSHPYDHIPFYPPTDPQHAGEAPTSVLPLYTAEGLPVQDPYTGGLVCSTCHDPHEPSYPIPVGNPSAGMPSFLRIGNPYQPDSFSPLCTYCHRYPPPFTDGEDLWIDRSTSSISFRPGLTGEIVEILVTVKNRGNIGSSGGYLEVFQEDDYGYSYWIGAAPVPYLMPEQSGQVIIPWTKNITGERAHFRIVLPPSPLNPARVNEFVKSSRVLPAPQLAVADSGPDSITLGWSMGYDPQPYEFNVYRDGVKINPYPIPYPAFTDYGLAPETPHTYTVEALDPQGSGFPSMSNRVGASTDIGYVIRVPQNYPTIGDAINAALPGTSIHVAAGTYREWINLNGRQGITIKGQDANGCTLDLTETPPGVIDLGWSDSGNTLAGFTVRGGNVYLSTGDVLYACVLDGSYYYPALAGGSGFITNCVFGDGAPNGVGVDPEGKLLVANSIFLGPDPLMGPPESYYLMNNDFVSWSGWNQYPGENNFSADPGFLSMTSLLLAPGSICIDNGAEVGLPFYGPAPDIGAFEFGFPYTPYTPRPPFGLTAEWVANGSLVRLEWAPSPDDPSLVAEYWIYRQATPEFPAVPVEPPLWITGPGELFAIDGMVSPGETWYYQVRASGAAMPSDEALSEPSNTASVNAGSPPIAVDDSVVTAEDTMVFVDVLGNDSDPDGDALSITMFGQGLRGVVQDAGGVLAYIPHPNLNGADSFTYTISDGNGGTATATVFVTVTPVNDPPIAANDTVTTAEDTPVTIGVLVNDSNPDGDVLMISAITQPAHGTAAIAGTSVTYTPSPDFSGADSFTYTVSDEMGAHTTGTVFVTVTPVNDPPTAVDDTAVTAEDVPAAISVMANDSDIDGDTLAISSLTQPAHGTAAIDGATVTYTPALNYNGADYFTYTVSDGNGGSTTGYVSIIVTRANDLPVAVDDTATTAEDVPVSIAVLANDSDIDGDALTISSLAQPAHGAVAIDGAGVTYTPALNYNGADSFTYAVSDGNGGTATGTVNITISPVADNPVARTDMPLTLEDFAVLIPVLANDYDPDGTPLTILSAAWLDTGTPPPPFPPGPPGDLTIQGDSVLYTPAPNYYGYPQFRYAIADGNGGYAEAVVYINVAAHNDPPTAGDDTATTAEDTAVTIAVLANDTDVDGDVLSRITSVTKPSHGTAVIAGSFVTYTPAANWSGTDSFVYVVTDGHIGFDNATVTVTVNPVNDQPVANDDAAETSEDTAIVIDILANDTDIDGGTLSISTVDQPAHGRAVVAGSSVTYTPAANWSGTDTFLYYLADGQGGFDTATVYITVTPVNDPPVAVNDAAATPEDVPITIGVLTNDSDADGDALTITSITQPANGTAAVAGTMVTYTPAANHNGADSFSYTISDGKGGSASAAVTVTVTPVNDPPVAVNDAATTPEDTPADIAVLANDSDLDGDTLTIWAVTQPMHGTAAIAGTMVTYTPAANYNGADSFSYIVSDGNGGSATASVTITVTPVNDPPVAVDDAASTAAFKAVIVAVLSNDSDVEGDPLTVTTASPGSNGTTEVLTDNTVRYAPSGSFTGNDGFTYTVSDGHGGSVTGTVTVEVRAQSLRIPSIAMTTATSSNSTQANAAIQVVDESGVALSGVTVSGHWTGLTSDTDTGITGADGKLTLSSNSVRNAKGTFTFVVDSSVKTGYLLDTAGSVMQNSISYPPPLKTHVASITMSLSTGKNGTTAKATVKVVGANGVAVSSATVTGSWSGVVTGTSSGSTNSSGSVTLSSPVLKNASGKTFTFTVTGITKSGWTYAPAANVETGDSITAP